MISRKDIVEEDLAIQDTLSMSVEQRLEMLAALIVDKIAEDKKRGETLYRKIAGLQNG